MGNVHEFPTSLATGRLAPSPSLEAIPANPRNRDTYGVYTVAGKLGQANMKPAALYRYLDALIADRGFPNPFPAPSVRGTVTDRVRHDSCWPAVAVDQWFFDRLPPQAQGAVGQAERVRIDSTLASRAAMIAEGFHSRDARG